MKTRTNSPPSENAARGRLALGAAGFVVLTVAVFWYQFSRVGADAIRPQWETLRWGYLALLLACLPIETATCAVRTWVTTRVLEPRITLWTCIQAEWANVAVSTLTPTQSWGGPGQVYVLSRGGASVGTSVTIMLTGFIGTLVALLALACYSLLVASAEGAWPLFLTVVGSFAGFGSVLACVAVWPTLLRTPLAALSRAVWRLRGQRDPLDEWWPPADPRTGPAVDRMGQLTAKVVDVVYTYRADVTRFLRRGKAAFVVICVLSLPFPISRAVIAYLCLRFLGIEASDFRHILEAQLILTLLEFFAPSPGGAGVIEIASSAVMAKTLPAGYAPYYNLLWRSSTLYLPAVAGFVCLAWALLQDRRRIMRPSWNRPSGAQRSEAGGDHCATRF